MKKKVQALLLRKSYSTNVGNLNDLNKFNKKTFCLLFALLSVEPSYFNREERWSQALNLSVNCTDVCLGFQNVCALPSYETQAKEMSAVDEPVWSFYDLCRFRCTRASSSLSLCRLWFNGTVLFFRVRTLGLFQAFRILIRSLPSRMLTSRY